MKYIVEFAYGDSFLFVDEWHTIDGLDCVEAEDIETALVIGMHTDGMDAPLFRVQQLIKNEFGDYERTGEPFYVDLRTGYYD